MKMKPMRVSVRRVGNSYGVIPKPVLAHLGLNAGAAVEMSVQGDALVLRRPAAPRAGWAEAAKRIAAAGDDALVMGEFGNAAD
jgi:antitoxin MazE